MLHKKICIVVLFTIFVGIAHAGADTPKLKRTDAASGQAAIICQYSVLQSVQVATGICRLSRRPVDDAIDQEVANIQEYMIANFPDHPTQAKFDAGRRTMRKEAAADPKIKRAFCQSELLAAIRSQEPTEIHAMVRRLLAAPAAAPQACL